VPSLLASNLPARPPRHATCSTTRPLVTMTVELQRCLATHGGGEVQKVAALPSHGRSRWFEPNHAHQHNALPLFLVSPSTRETARNPLADPALAVSALTGWGFRGSMASTTRLAQALVWAPAPLRPPMSMWPVPAALMADQFVDYRSRGGCRPTRPRECAKDRGAPMWRSEAHGWTLPDDQAVCWPSLWMLGLDPAWFCQPVRSRRWRRTGR
jgi:hypothetical protein